MAQVLESRTKNNLAVYYYAYRRSGSRAIEAYRAAHNVLAETDEWRKENLIAGKMMQAILPLVVAVGLTVYAFQGFYSVTLHGVWVTSPSGKTTRQLPCKLANRVIRRRHWRFARVEPVQPKRLIGRKEALQILIRGDK